jgi:hypothetical protein
VLLVSSWNLSRTRKSKHDELVILGNGPSLTPFLNDHLSFLENKNTLVVNFFARTQFFEIIRPSYYIIISPEYFLNEQKKEFAEDRLITFQAIAEKTTWPMQLVVPALARSRNAWKSLIASNPNIEIKYLNTTPVEGFMGICHKLFNRNLGMPRPHNVLIPSIFLAIQLKYKLVYLVGADHSWLPEIRVDDDNEVLLRQKHFYDKQAEKEKSLRNQPIARPMYKGITTEKRKLHEVLEKFYISIKSYWVLHLR